MTVPSVHFATPLCLWFPAATIMTALRVPPFVSTHFIGICFFFVWDIRSFVRNNLKTFCQLFVFGHFLWLKKALWPNRINFFDQWLKNTDSDRQKRQKDSRFSDYSHLDNSHLGQLPPHNCHLWQLSPRTTATAQLPPMTTVTYDNCHLERSPPRKLPTKTYWILCVYCH